MTYQFSSSPNSFSPSVDFPNGVTKVGDDYQIELASTIDGTYLGYIRAFQGKAQFSVAISLTAEFIIE